MRSRTPNIPEIVTTGFCACGCGQRTPTSKKGHAKNGVFLHEGQPFRFIPGHHLRPSTSDRFWSKVNKAGQEDCWNWQDGKRPNGYGQFWKDGKSITAHRAAYELVYGLIPEGKWITHHCDNRLCCNPKHLYAGTATDNNRDTVNRNRTNPRRGSHCPTSKLSEDKVKIIRNAYIAGGITMQQLADQYKVTASVIHDVIHHKSWAHVK